MNRQIKFRIYNKRTNQWIHGPGEEVSLFGEMILLGGFLKGVFIQDLEYCVALQFTGLLDSNNKEIYEGDIIVEKWTELNFCRDGYGIIEPFSIEKYTRTYEVIYMLSQFNIENQLSGKVAKKDFERKVVGNIFDNAELLTK